MLLERNPGGSSIFRFGERVDFYDRNADRAKGYLQRRSLLGDEIGQRSRIAGMQVKNEGSSELFAV
jgi:hypothetical protein